MVDSASFGEWIRRRRRALDLTREMLARQVGCAVVTIRKIETDERRPSRQVAERLAECLRIPADLQAAFLQVARGELAVDRMPVPVLSAEPASMMQAISSAYEGFEHLPLSSVAEQHSASVPTPPSVLSRRKLPEPISSFVGRAEEIIEICHHLSQARLLTLIGVGGIGKTRLAIEVARRAEAEYSGGAVWVDLAGLTDAQLVPQAVATALSVSEVPGRSPIETLIETIRAQKVFILLDNCEHLIEACAVLVMTLLQSCSQLRLFVTSREPLNLIGEITVAVSPLELPMLSDGSAGDLPRELEIGLDRLATSSETAAQNVEASALKLFVERASAVLPAFKLMQADVSAITQICQRLEGLPLAIELAAARVSVMNVQQIAARLNSSFDLLTGGNRAGLPRHRSLQATIDWSYALLSEEEQRFFRQLSVFSGGFTLETVEAVYALASASAQPRGHTTTDVVELMSQLVNKSLIVSGMRYTAGQERFRLLEPVRQYAAARLSAAGETEWLEARHAAFFRSLAAESAPRLIGPQRSAALKQLEQEHDNIRAALGWCRAKAPIDPQARETGLEIGVNLLWFWYFGGYAREGYTAFESLLDGATVAVFQKLHANACRVAGLLAWRIGDYPAARILLEDSLRLGENCGDQVCAAFSLIILGVVGLFQGDITAALVCSEQAVVRMRALNDQWALALALYCQGNVLLYTGNPDASIQSTNESAAGFRVLGDAWGLGMALHDLGRVSLARKHNQPAYAQFQESVEMLRREGDTWMLCNALDGLGHATLAQGDLEGATVHFRDLFSLASAKGQTFFVILMIEGMACIACARGAFANGAELFGAADAFRELLGAPLAPFMRAVYEPFRAAAAAALGEGLLAGAETQGRALTPEQAIERALKTETSSIAYSTEHNP